MKNTIFALPALLRSAVFLAAASQSSFSVHDDLLAFPQYEILFSENFISEAQAQARLFGQGKADDNAPSHLEEYRPPENQRLANDEQTPEEIKFEYESLMMEGQRYLCSIPQIKKPEGRQDANNNTATLTKAEQEKELARATDRGWELLSGMQDNCVYFISGWWSYRFCYNDGVRQFHQLPPSKGVPVWPPTEDPGVNGFTLGKYPEIEETDGLSREDVKESGLDVSSNARKTSKNSGIGGELVQRGESRYLVQRLDGGTKCDLTNKDRRIEVQFHCNPQAPDRISLIKETSTCAYLMVIHTPRLCHDVAFLPPQKDQPHPITCAPVLAEDEVAAYHSHVSVFKEAFESAQSASPTQSIVGDIVVGGRNIVPADLTLEKSAIVGGGKETFIATVASSKTDPMSKEELEKLGVDAKIVAELSKMLKTRAQGHGWKLNIVQTARGREFSGVVLDGSEEKGADKEKDSKKAKKDDQGDDGEESEGSKEEYYKDEL